MLVDGYCMLKSNSDVHLWSDLNDDVQFSPKCNAEKPLQQQQKAQSCNSNLNMNNMNLNSKASFYLLFRY